MDSREGRIWLIFGKFVGNWRTRHQRVICPKTVDNGRASGSAMQESGPVTPACDSAVGWLLKAVAENRICKCVSRCPGVVRGGCQHAQFRACGSSTWNASIDALAAYQCAGTRTRYLAYRALLKGVYANGRRQGLLRAAQLPCSGGQGRIQAGVASEALGHIHPVGGAVDLQGVVNVRRSRRSGHRSQSRNRLSDIFRSGLASSN